MEGDDSSSGTINKKSISLFSNDKKSQVSDFEPAQADRLIENVTNASDKIEI